MQHDGLEIGDLQKDTEREKGERQNHSKEGWKH